jgi:hypothetical protein
LVIPPFQAIFSLDHAAVAALKAAIGVVFCFCNLPRDGKATPAVVEVVIE